MGHLGFEVDFFVFKLHFGYKGNAWKYHFRQAFLARVLPRTHSLMLIKVRRSYFSTFRTVSSHLWHELFIWLPREESVQEVLRSASFFCFITIWGPPSKAQKHGWSPLVFRKWSVLFHSCKWIRSWVSGLFLYNRWEKCIMFLKKSNVMISSGADKKIENSPLATEKFYLRKTFPHCLQLHKCCRTNAHIDITSIFTGKLAQSRWFYCFGFLPHLITTLQAHNPNDPSRSRSPSSWPLPQPANSVPVPLRFLFN